MRVRVKVFGALGRTLRLMIPADSWLFGNNKDKKVASTVVPIIAEGLPIVLPIIQALITSITHHTSNANVQVPTPDLTTAVSNSVTPVVNLLAQNGVIQPVDAGALSGAIQTLIHTQINSTSSSTPAPASTTPTPTLTPAPAVSTPAPSVISGLGASSQTLSGTIGIDGKSYNFSGTLSAV